MTNEEVLKQFDKDFSGILVPGYNAQGYIDMSRAKRFLEQALHTKDEAFKETLQNAKTYCRDSCRSNSNSTVEWTCDCGAEEVNQALDDLLSSLNLPEGGDAV